jgi:hypothetical protein
MAGSPDRSVANETNKPPASIPICTVDAVAVERFLMKPSPTLPRLAVEILDAAEDRV